MGLIFGQFHFYLYLCSKNINLNMARKDQIATAGAIYVSTNWDSDIPNVLIECFEKGADWADEHPLPSTEEDNISFCPSAPTCVLTISMYTCFFMLFCLSSILQC